MMRIGDFLINYNTSEKDEYEQSVYDQNIHNTKNKVFTRSQMGERQGMDVTSTTE